MQIIKNCVFNTIYIEKNKKLVFDVSYKINNFDDVSFIVNATEKILLIEMDKIAYKSIHYVSVDQKKILVDFYSDIKIKTKENEMTKILSGIVIPDFYLDKWNKISIIFKKRILKNKLFIYSLSDNITQYTNINLQQNKKFNHTTSMSNNFFHDINNVHVISDPQEKEQYYGENVKNNKNIINTAKSRISVKFPKEELRYIYIGTTKNGEFDF